MIRLASLSQAEGHVDSWLLFDIELEFYQPVAEKAEELARESRLALVIGNSSYGDAPLNNTVNDARDMAAALKRCGFDVILLLDANRNQMWSTIREFGGKLKKGGVGLFYYAGHGVQVHGQNFLVPVAADIRHEDEVEDESVLVSSVLGKMASAANRINIVILDACRNNSYARSFRSHTQGLVEIKIGFPQYDGSLPNATTGSLVAYSTEPGELAADGKGSNGLYTSKLLKYLEKPGMDAHDVFTNVRREVIEATSGKQIPWESNSLTGDFYFVPPREGELGYADDSQPSAPARREPSAFSRNQIAGERPTTPVTFEEMVHVADFDFHIDRTEVTNAEYARFLSAEGNQLQGGMSWLDITDEEALIESAGSRFVAKRGLQDHPVIEVTWYGAAAYCAWRDKRLPSSGEWETAAIGTDGRRYPWGDDGVVTEGGQFRANLNQGTLAEDGYIKTAPVGSFSTGASPYGALDMIGNVSEWVSDEVGGGERLMRGGSFDNELASGGGSFPADPSMSLGDTGFRCARFD